MPHFNHHKVIAFQEHYRSSPSSKQLPHSFPKTIALLMMIRLHYLSHAFSLKICLSSYHQDSFNQLQYRLSYPLISHFLLRQGNILHAVVVLLFLSIMISTTLLDSLHSSKLSLNFHTRATAISYSCLFNLNSHNLLTGRSISAQVDGSHIVELMTILSFMTLIKKLSFFFY